MELEQTKWWEGMCYVQLKRAMEHKAIDYSKLDSNDKDWNKKVNAVLKKYSPKSNFDLPTNLKRIVTIISPQEAYIKERAQKVKDINGLEKIRKLERQKEKILNGISKSTKNEIDSCVKKRIKSYDPHGDTTWSIHGRQDFLLNVCSLYIDESHHVFFKNKRGKTNKYPKIEVYIKGLAAIFYAITGEMPICKKTDRVNDAYSGKFYEFLLDIRSLLKEIGIDLGKESTIGKYANRQQKEYKQIILTIPAISRGLRESQKPSKLLAKLINS